MRKDSHTVDPTKDHHMINGQLVPVGPTPSRSRSPRPTSSGRKTANKNKGVIAHKSPPSTD